LGSNMSMYSGLISSSKIVGSTYKLYKNWEITKILTTNPGSRPSIGCVLATYCRRDWTYPAGLMVMARPAALAASASGRNDRCFVEAPPDALPVERQGRFGREVTVGWRGRRNGGSETRSGPGGWGLPAIPRGRRVDGRAPSESSPRYSHGRRASPRA